MEGGVLSDGMGGATVLALGDPPPAGRRLPLGRGLIG
jgi:hypothetical protein